MDLLERMVPTPEDLFWLRDAMIDRIGEWRGSVELRGVLSHRCKPLDGITAPAPLALAETSEVYEEFNPLKPTCPTCDGTGWKQSTGGVTRCECIRAKIRTQRLIHG